MRRQPIVFLLIFAVGVGFPLSAIDWGSTINTTSGVVLGEQVDQRFTETAQASAYVQHFVSEELMLSVEGNYRFNMTVPFADSTTFDLYHFNLNHLYARGDVTITGENAGVISYRVGRFGFSDATAVILNDRLDGGRARIQGNFGSMLFAAGYSGFTAKDSSTIQMTRRDVDIAAAEDRYLAPRRVIGQFRLTLPRIADLHEIGVFGLYAHDLNPEGSLADDQGRLSTGYFGARFRGPIAGNFSYRAFGAYQAGQEYSRTADSGNGYEYAPKHGYLAGASVRYLNREALYSLAELRYIHSSGDGDYRTFYEGNTSGNAMTFTGISSPALGVVFAPRLGNLMVANAAYSFQPFAATERGQSQQLQLRVDGYGYLRETGGAISESGIDPDADGRYLGAEANLAVNYRPFSDLGFALVGGIFVPNNSGSGSAFDPERRGIEYRAQLTTSFSF